MKKLSIIMVAVLLVMSLLTGCGGGSAAPASTDKQQAATTAAPAKNNKVIIGFSQCTLDSPFYVALMDAAKASATAKGAELIYVDAQNNVQKQNNDVMDLISKGINVLIINPVQAEGIQPALDAAKKKGIKIIAVDRPVTGDVDSFVGRDNKKMGQLVGEKAVELLGGKGKAQGVILELQGDAGGKVMEARRDGFHVAVDQEKGIKVIQSPYCDYTRSKAIAAAQDIFQANKDITLIYGHNDDMALGGLQVAEQNGLKGVKVVGVDGLMEAVKAISDGKYEATAGNDPGVLGTLAVNAAIDLASGKTVEKYLDGGTVLIDKSNAASYYNKDKVFAEFKK